MNIIINPDTLDTCVGLLKIIAWATLYQAVVVSLIFIHRVFHGG